MNDPEQAQQPRTVKYVTPGFKKPAFTCPFCEAYSSFSWTEVFLQSRNPVTGGDLYTSSGLWIAFCFHCKRRVVWFGADGWQGMIWPAGVANAPLPHEDMPEDVAADYAEARSICNASPRGAAALLRLAIQKLCAHLGETGKDLNEDIGNLVKKGLPVTIQRALDVVRVTGNNAVHPGELRVEDDPEIVQALFRLVNLIVENRIAEPKRIDAMYGSLPEGARRAIERRDG